MDIDQFWQLHENLPIEEPDTLLKERLLNLSKDDLIEYQKIFDSLHAKAYIYKLWGAAYIIIGGCSDDGFIDFRSGLIAKGRKVYEDAIADPDSLADHIDDEDDEVACEEVGYVASMVYEEKFGEEMPHEREGDPSKPAGESWDYDSTEENHKFLPKLSKIYWDFD